jgi:RNA polymerase sigma-70 factor (ECF subfamily)
MSNSNVTMAERELIYESINGSRLSQKKLYDMYAPLMFSVCLRYAGNYDDACDILQDGFIKVFSNLRKFDFKGSFQGWIRRIIINTCIDFYRTRKTDLSFETSENTLSEFTAVDNDALARISSEEMLNAIRRLPASQRIILSLYAIDGYEHSEIASMLRISESASRSTLAKARKSLSAQFKSLLSLSVL